MPVKVLACRMNQDEINDKAQELARRCQELNDEKERKKDAAASYAAAIKSLETIVSNLSRCVATGEEWREVDILEWYDHERGYVYVKRLDTGAVIEERPMTAKEMLMPLRLDDRPELTEEVHQQEKEVSTDLGAANSGRDDLERLRTFDPESLMEPETGQGFPLPNWNSLPSVEGDVPNEAAGGGSLDAHTPPADSTQEKTDDE